MTTTGEAATGPAGEAAATGPAPAAGIEAARIHGPGDIRVAREAAPVPAPGEVLLRVGAVGLCGSDLHWWEEAAIGDARLSAPLVLGHELSGVIASGPRSGERVVVDPAGPCERCAECLAARPNLCPTTRFAGHGTTDGGLRTLMAWPERLLHPAPAGIGPDEATLLEPLGVALHAADLARVRVGGRAGVFGCGPLGLLLVQVLRLAGAGFVVATDRLAHRVAAAASLGADEALLAGGGSQVGVAYDGERYGGEPVDVAFEVAGTDEALADALAAVRPGGRVVLVGIPAGDRTTIPAGLARRKGLTLMACRRMVPADLDRAIALAAAGRVELASLVTERFPLRRAPEAFGALAARRGLKVVVNPPG